MVATVVGSRLGLEQTSAWVLGSRGQLGASALGRGGENVFVNAATGNLVVRGQDEFLVGLGADISVSRAYNSQGALNDDNGDNWRFSIQRRLINFPASPGAAGSTVTRIGEDGADLIYTWDGSRYRSTEGAGADDLLVRNGDGSWTWTDGDTGVKELYDSVGNLINVTDTDGNETSFLYELHNGVWRLTRVTANSGGYIDIVWSGENVTQLTTFYSDVATATTKSLTRTRYAYDSLNRLTSVTVDLSPEDNSVADGRTYVIAYTYDGTSKRVASISQTDGSRVDIQYETSGAYRVKAITLSVAEGSSRTTRYTYVSSTLTDVTAPDGLTTRMEYDGEGRLISIQEPPPVTGASPSIRTFQYHANGSLYRTTVNGGNATYYYYDGDDNGLWTLRQEDVGGAYILTRRTFNAANALLTETRHQSLDTIGHGTAAGAMTTRYVYDAENHLRFVVQANGEVTRHNYYNDAGRDGLLSRTVVYTGSNRFDLSGLAWNDPISEAAMIAWEAGLADKTAAQSTDFVYDVRGALLHTYNYVGTLVNGQPDTSAYTRTSFIYDQAGRVLWREVNGVAGVQTFVYDGLGRLISAVDVDGGTTRTAYHDRNGVVVETTADGLNKVSVYNRAGERVSYSESERGPNLVDMSGWPEYDLEAPNGPASLPYWPTHYNNETRWQVTIGPDGKPVVAMNSGQTIPDQSGGGSHTNDFNIDASKGYEFTFYFKKNDLSAHFLYFGLTANGSQPYVEGATNGSAYENPYFLALSSGEQASLFQADRWYKVVGYVLPQGSANIAPGSMGGVFDAETGAKVTNVNNFRWSTTRASNDVHARFFDFYDEGQLGFSTQFYKPEVRRLDQPGTNLIRLEGWPGPADAPNGGAIVPGWINGWETNETAWKVIDGPDGRQVVAMQAGQYHPDEDGGGGYTNEFAIDGSKSYEFVYYIRKDKLNDHALFFGLSSNTQAYVEYADGSAGGAAETNPYFFGSHASNYAPYMAEDRWYKVVGHVLAEGSANVAHGSLGGVFDMETGQKVMNTYAFRWRASRPNNQAYSRFFTYYDEGKTGFSTYFYKPEVYRTDQPGVNLVNTAGWPAAPSDPTAEVPGWNTTSLNAETRWQVTDGPEGRKVVAIQTGQFDQWDAGGGAYTNWATIDGTKAYEFTVYLRKDDLDKHYLYWGLTPSTQPYVDNAIDGSAEQNPYFYATTSATQRATLIEDRWYKVVGYVLPQGAGNLTWAQAPGGVYDTVTGEKVAQTQVFRWRADRPDNRVFGRFFNYYEHTQGGWSTSFYKPEIREISASSLTGLMPAESTQYRYDKMGRLRLTIDPTGRTTHFLYDNLGRKVGEVDGDGSLVEYKYDAQDRLIGTVRYATRLTAADIRSLTDGAGNPAPTEVAWVRPAASAEDAWTWTVYDNAGRVIQTIDGDGSSIAYVYDGASRLIGETRYAERLTAGQLAGFKTTPPSVLTLPSATAGVDRITRFFYDAAGRRVGTLDAEGFYSRIVYDAAGQVVQTSAYTNAIAAGLRASGSLNDILTSINSDANDIHTWSVYDGRGFLMGTVNGEGDVVLYTYNSLGHVVQKVTGKRLTPPPTSQPTLAQLVAAPAPSSLDQTAWDRNHLGQVTQEHRYTAQGWETTTYTYDVMHRLVGTHTDRLPNQGPDYATRNRYDARGRLIGQLNGRGAAALAALGSSPTKAQVDDVYRIWGVAFAYDAADRLISRTDPDGASGDGFTTFYFYDADGALAYEVREAVTHGGVVLGEVKGYLYDAQNRRTQAIAFGTHVNMAGLKGGAVVSQLPSRTALSASDSRVVTVYNVDDTVRSTTDPLGADTLYSHNAFNELAERQDPFGAATGTVTRFGYDRRGLKVHTWEDALGLNRTTYVAYDAFGRANYSIDGRGVARTTLYDRAGRVKVVKDGLNNQTTYAYDPRGNVMSVTDALGKTTVFSSDPHNRTQTVTTAEGLVTTSVYDDQGHILSVTDGAGRATAYAYDLDGRLVTVTNGLNQQDISTYDVAGRLYETTDASGRKVRYAYDGAGRVLTETVDPGGLNLTTSYVYDAKGQRLRIYDPLNRRTEYQYDLAGRLRYVSVDADGLALLTQYVYDRAGNVTMMREAEGTSAQRDTVYVYDKLNRLQSKQVGDAGLYVKSEYVYDGSDQVTYRRDYLSSGQYVETRFVYDAEERLVLTVDAAGGVVRNVYDAEGRIVQTVAYADVLTPAERSALGQAPTAVQIEAYVTANATDDRSTSYVYDADGRLAFTVDPVRAVTRIEYDGSGNVVRRTTYETALPAGTSLTYANLKALANGDAVFGGGLIFPEGASIQAAVYDAAGRQVYSLDPEGAVTAYVYDAAGRLLQTVACLADTSLTEWGNTLTKAQMDSWIAANGGQGFQKTQFAYDGAGRATYVVDAAGYVTRTTYNAAGLVTEEARFASTFSIGDGATAQSIAALLPAHEATAVKTGYGYDSAGRRTTVVNAMGGTTVTELNGLGKAVKVTDPRGSVGFFYYDGAGRLSLQVDPEGYGTTTTYWTGEIVETVTRHGERGVGTPTVATRPTFATHPKDATTTFTRDNAGRVIQTRDAEGYTETYVLNAFGDRTSVTNKIGGVTTYTYDKRGLMLTETLPVSSVRADGVVMATSVVNTYSYDVRGNLKQTVEASNVSADARTTTYAYDKLNRLVRKSGDAVTVTSSTDFSTSTVTPTETIAYDSYGNVIETVNAGGARTLFYYDALNRKTAEIDAVGTLRKWAYDANDNATSARVYDTAVSLPATAGGTAPAGSGTYRETLYAYDRNNRLTSTTIQNLWVGEYGASYISSFTDITVQQVYDAAGNVVQTIDGRGVSTYAFYDKLGRQIATVDGEGYPTTWTRDAEGNVLREIRYADKVIGAVTAGRDPATLPPRNFSSDIDRITDFTYDRNGRRLTETRYTVYVYNAAASDKLSAAHAVITYAYDGLGGVTRKTEANGDNVNYEYDLLGRQKLAWKSAFTDHTGATVWNTTTTSYDGLGAVTRATEGNLYSSSAEQRITTFTYQKGRLASATDANGFTRSFGYDAMGRVTQESYNRTRGDVDGAYLTEARRYAYDALGRLTLEGSAAYSGGWSYDGRTTAYNAHGEVVAKGVNGLWQERFEYDKAGRLWRSTGGDGVTRLFVHDRAGRTTMTVTATERDVTAWSIDDVIWSFTAGNTAVIGTHDVSGTALTFSRYDARGLLLDSRQPFAQLSRDLSTGAYATATVTQARAYNAFGEVISETDARGFVTDFTYNTMGRLIETRRPETAYTTETGQVLYARPTEQNRYDISGRLVATRSANGHWTSRTLLAGSGHNGEEAVVLATYNPDGGVFDNKVNVFGELVLVGNGLGGYVTNLYDKVGNLVERRQVARDAYTPGNPTGSAVQLIDYYAYDGLGQRIGHWNSQFGSGFKERTAYDREGRVTFQTDFEGRATSYAYTWDTNLVTSGLGAFGGWVKTTYHASNKTSVEQTDVFGRVVGKTDMSNRTYAMGYDRGGRQVSQVGTGQSLSWSWFNTGQQARMSDATLGTQADYAYDAAGHRTRERYYAAGVVQQDGYAEYDAMGRMTRFEDRAANASDPTRSVWAFDLNGNVRSTQSWSRHVDHGASTPTSPMGGAWYRYDTMNRMVHIGNLTNGQIVGGQRLEYDAAGNRRRVLTDYSVQTDNQIGWGETWVPDPDPGGGGGGEVIIIDPDPGGGGGGGGHWEYYPIYEYRAGQQAETFTYTADGYLAEVGKQRDEWNTTTDTVQMGAVTTISRDVRDAAGRVTRRTEWSGERSGVNESYDREATYDRAGLITWSKETTYKRDDIFTNTTANFTTQQTTYNYYEGSLWRGVVTAVTTSGFLDPWPQGTGSNSNVNLPGTRTDYTYGWWDEARQASIVYDSDTGSGSNAIRTSTFTLDVNGRVSSVYIADDRPRTVTFVTDANGQVLTRTEQDNNPNLADPIDRYYYFGGQRIGQVTNNASYETNYAGEMYNRGWSGPTSPKPFGSSDYARYGVDFDLAYEALTPHNIRSGGTAWTVRSGDTLQGIAAATWGDASLWYLIAEANGLTGASLLTPGQTITVPAKVGNVHNNSDTFRPYDPNETLGDVSPTQAKPPKNGGRGCGVIGQIIAVVIAVVVAAATYGALAGALGVAGNAAAGSALSTVGSTLSSIGTAAGSSGLVASGAALSATGASLTAAATAGAAIAGAAGGVAGALASQAFLIATGAQDRLDWKGIGLAAISGGIGGGLGIRMPASISGSKAAAEVARGVTGNILTQGVAVATGLQDKFDWSGVAVSAVVAGTTSVVGSSLPAAGPLSGRAVMNDLISGGAGAIAGAAARSVINGSNFGDNLIAVLPDVIGTTIGNAVVRGMTVASARAEFIATAGPDLVAAAVKSGYVPAGSVDMDVLNARLEAGYDEVMRADTERGMKAARDEMLFDALDQIYRTPEQQRALGRGQQWTTRYDPRVFGYQDGSRPEGYVGGFDLNAMEAEGVRGDVFIGGREYNYLEISSLFTPLAGTTDATGATILNDIAITAQVKYAFHSLIDEPGIQLGNLAYNVGGQIDAYLEANPEIGIGISIVDFGLKVAKGPLGFVASTIVDEATARGAEHAVGWAAGRFEGAAYQDSAQGGLGVFLAGTAILGSGKGALDLLRNSGRLVERLSNFSRRFAADESGGGPPIGGRGVASIELPGVAKVVNSNLPHAVDRALEHGIFSTRRAAADEFRLLGDSITSGGWPSDAFRDTARANRVLVPIGEGGLAVYQVGSNGTAKLKTVLIAR